MGVAMRASGTGTGLSPRYSGDGKLALWEHRYGTEKIPEKTSRFGRIVLILLPDAYAAVREWAAIKRDKGAISSAPATLRRWLDEFEKTKKCDYNPKADTEVGKDFEEQLRSSRRLSALYERNIAATISVAVSEPLALTIEHFADMKSDGDNKTYLKRAIFQKAMSRLTGKSYNPANDLAQHDVAACATG